MNPRSTGLWLIIAAALFAFIFFYQSRVRRPQPGPERVLPTFKAAAINSIQVQPQGRELEIRVERTNDTWQMRDPLPYPGQNAAIEAFLDRLEALTADTYIAERELKNRANADEEYGFTAPQATVVLQPGDHRLRFGRSTAPGNQVYLQLVGVEGIYVINSELLKQIPQRPDEWRDPSLVDWQRLLFDRLSVTNGTTIFSLQHDATNQLWRIVAPSLLRANQVKIEEALQKLQSLRAQSFVSDDPKTDLEPLGLQPPRLEIGLARDTNSLQVLQFGVAPTNSPKRVYAKLAGQNTIVTVDDELLSPWRAPLSEFRDPHLVVLTAPVDLIDIRAAEAFSLQLQSTGTWTMVSNSLPIDADLVKHLIDSMANLQVVEFVKGIVTDPDLPTYGLAPAPRQYRFQTSSTNTAGALTNIVLAEVHFGSEQENKVFARRTDESSVYAVRLADLLQLPKASWQLRSRQIWNVSENEVSRVTINQRGKTRQLVRNGQYKWSLAAGSQGILDASGLAEEETLRGLCHLNAAAWVAIGEASRPRYGFTDDGYKVSLELKSGEKLSVEFGGEAPSQFPYAAVRLHDKLWIFEFPLALYRHVASYFSIPPNVP